MIIVSIMSSHIKQIQILIILFLVQIQILISNDSKFNQLPLRKIKKNVNRCLKDTS
jgi:type IV secretory pathway VirB3-like protein